MASPDKRRSLGENEPTPKKAKLATDYVCSALECLKISLVDHDPSLPLAVPEFKPEMAHQVFGETEEVSGYSGLHIGIHVSAHTGHTWVDVQYTQKRFVCDDINSALSETFPTAVHSQQEFQALLATPPPNYWGLGREVDRVQLRDGSEVVVQLHQLATASKEIQELHHRFEPLLVFFVDGASAIEADEPRWDLLLALNKSKEGRTRVVGFCTVYNYYCYPEGVRPRLSQILVFPPYQGQGVGAAFLRSAYSLARERNGRDLTFEEPAPELQTLRQRLELRMLQSLPWFVEQADALIDSALGSSAASGKGKAVAVANGRGENARESAADKLQLPRGVLTRLREEQKIHIAEARQVWEAYLWQQPRMQAAAGRLLLVQAIHARLHVLHFSSVELNAQGKSVRVLSEDGCVFDMMRRELRGGAAEGGSAEAAGTSGSGDGGAVNVGKRNVSQVSSADIQTGLEQLVEERVAELERVTRKSDK